MKVNFRAPYCIRAPSFEARFYSSITFMGKSLPESIFLIRSGLARFVSAMSTWENIAFNTI